MSHAGLFKSSLIRETGTHSKCGEVSTDFSIVDTRIVSLLSSTSYSQRVRPEYSSHDQRSYRKM